MSQYEEASSGRPSGDQLTHRVSHRERPPITLAEATAAWSATTRSADHMVELLSIAHERGCEAQLAALLTDDVAADRLPDLKVLRERFAPDLASLPEVSVHLTPLTVYEALNDSYIGEAA